ncbi:g667 [Coccomyxa viridis]|uniref:G667 protein n=1 Tax=Coccomyxa viridis TaxID=1274662 RepID=A0ABP1FHX3_9CHLO
MRWLTRRVPGVTHLICNATFAGSESEVWAKTLGATWLVAQLPELCSASTATFKLHLTLGSVVAAKLFRLNTNYCRIQDDIWGALSERMTELTLNLTPHKDEPMRMSVLTQLTSLVSLEICIMGDPLGDMDDEVTASYHLSLPGLESLHMRGINAKNLSLHCPRLRNLVMDYPYIEGILSLPASLEDFAIRGVAPFHEPFPVSNLLGLTSLLCHVPLSIDRDALYAALPSMSALRKLDIISFFGQLPPLLPPSLRAVRYFVTGEYPLSSQELQHFAKACKLPELQSMGLYNCQTWKPYEIRTLQKIQQECKANIIVEKNWKDEDRVASGGRPG